MPVSKNRKEHKQKLNKHKQTKKMEQNQANQALSNQMPPVRNVPTWASDATIKLAGYEWEAIFNGLVQLNAIQQAAQSVMSRNIVEGTIKMVFEKLNPTTLQYEPMTPEESKSYDEQFQAMLEKVRTQATATQAEGKIATNKTSAETPVEITEDVVAEVVESKIITAEEAGTQDTGAKIIQMNG